MEYTIKTKPGIINILSLLFVFAGIFIFFQGAHPVVPWDGDDWGTLNSYSRHAFPSWGTWNPSRIFPEVFGPITGYFAAYVVYPLQGDYVQSISLCISLLLATATTVFFYTLCRVFFTLSKKEGISIFTGLLVMVLYFLIFKSKADNNFYMLWSYNLCTVFYYVLPNLINSALVCYFIDKRLNNQNIQLTENTIVKYSLLVFVLYYACFSILWGSSILAAFIFYEIVFGIVARKFSGYWNEILKYNKVYLFIILLFFTYCVFEFFGGRSELLQKTQSAGLSASITQFMLLAKQTEVLFLGFCVLALVAAVVVRFRTKETSPAIQLVIRSLVCMVSLTVFYILATVKAGPEFASRIESVYGVYFFLILAVALSVVYVLTKYPVAFIALPVLVSILFVETTRSYKPYSFGNWTDTSSLKKYNYMTGWIAQVKKADKEGQTSVTIKYPANLGVWFGAMSEALYAHNIISKPIQINTEKVEETKKP